MLIFFINTLFHMFNYLIFCCNSFINNKTFAIFSSSFFFIIQNFFKVYLGDYHSYYSRYIHYHILIVQFFHVFYCSYLHNCWFIDIIFILNIIIPQWIFAILWQWCSVLFCNSLIINIINCFSIWDFLTVFIFGWIFFLLFCCIQFFLRYTICLFALSFSILIQFSTLFSSIVFFVPF